MKNILFKIGQPIVNTIWIYKLSNDNKKYIIESISDKYIEFYDTEIPFKSIFFLKSFIPFEQYIFQLKYKDKNVPKVNEEWINKKDKSAIKILNIITVYGEDFIIYQFKNEAFPNDPERKFYMELDRFMKEFEKVGINGL